MRSSAARLTLGAAAWIAIGAAASFIVQSEQQLTRRREAVRLFDVRASDAAVALADARNAQHAYVVPGQALGVWTARVDAFLTNATAALEDLRQTAADPGSRQLLVDATTSLADLRNVDKRAREYLASAQPLMAADVVFSEGLEMAATAGRQLETARIAEHAAWVDRRHGDAAFAGLRRRRRRRAVGSRDCLPGLCAIVQNAGRLETDASQGRRHATGGPMSDLGRSSSSSFVPASGWLRRRHAAQFIDDLPREPMPILKAAVDVCTDLNRARDFDDLNKLLGRAANAIDASGLIVWVGSAAGASLRPVLAYGYSAPALARMPLVARSDDNAAAAAVRTGELQIVCSRPGVSSGALAVPMLSREGCIGALTAEIKNGGETSEGVQAIAAIFAAQLAGVLADSVPVDGIEESKIASA